MNILVVEDDRTIASGLTYSLEQEGFTTVLRHTAKDATAAIEEQLAPSISASSICLYLTAAAMTYAHSSKRNATSRSFS